MPSKSRRAALRTLISNAVGVVCAPFAFHRQTTAAMVAPAPSCDSEMSATSTETVNATNINWSDTFDRTFLSGDCWANPMEDWRVVDGAAECSSDGIFRNVQLLTHQLTNPQGRFLMSVKISQVQSDANDHGVGFQIGVRSELNEYRSNAFSRNGIPVGIAGGRLKIGNQSVAAQGLANPQDVTLSLSGSPDGDSYSLTLTATASDGTEISTLQHQVAPDSLLGNVAIVNNFILPRRGGKGKGKGKVKGKKKSQWWHGSGGRYRFNDWAVSGDAFTPKPDNRFGPLLWSMYSLSDSRGADGFVMKFSALTGPMGKQDNQDVELWIKKNGQWEILATAPLDQDAWVASFRIPNWDEKTETPYKVVYQELHRSGKKTESVWEGTIKANPTGRALRLAALTCQKDYGFPYAPVADNVVKLDPDMVYFSGDQLYEGHGGYGLIREPADRAILNYLRKYYMHGWAFRYAMKNAPTICLPDDHDVFHGNIWGESGAAMRTAVDDASSHGGYREPASMVNAVHKTTVGHHPDYYDDTPVKQGISVYYGDMVYGDVSFAIISDRQFKSGPEHVFTGEGRADHVLDKDFDTATLDKPGLVLLGQRQEDFLRHWVDDWRGHKLKVLLSQTVFAGVATHHGSRDGYLKGDLDSGAWPQTPRNNAINILKPAMPLHVNGDQHLTTLSQYGVESQRDSFWSFCTPAISAGYPRWWLPDEAGMPHKNRPEHGFDNTGEYTDGFGNLVYVYAVGNPEIGTKKNRYELAHQKGSGFGMVTIDTAAKTYTLESFRFLIDATDGNPENQFPGWPVTIDQSENAGDNKIK